jgi:hypothetical protein
MFWLTAAKKAKAWILIGIHWGKDFGWELCRAKNRNIFGFSFSSGEGLLPRSDYFEASGRWGSLGRITCYHLFLYRNAWYH